MVYWDLFLTYLKIGLFGFGGGYAMLPLIQHEVVNKHHWLTITQFTDIIAISQVTPGPIAINSATYIGYTATGNIYGSILATLGVCLPPTIIMLIMCKFYISFKHNQMVEGMFMGIRPVVIGLMASAAVMLMNKESFIDYSSYLIFGISFLVCYYTRLNAILLILGAAAIGCLIY